MKKIIAVMVTIILMFSNISAYAIPVSSYEEINDREYAPLIHALEYKGERYTEFETQLNIARISGRGACIFEVNGELYGFDRGWRTPESSSVKLSGEHLSGPNVIWTGEYYYTRDPQLDGYWYDASKYACPLNLYDETGNIVKSLDLKNKYKAHAMKIGYLNGTYYCELSGDSVIKSTDFENWEETDEEVPQQFCNIMTAGDKLSLDKTNFLYVKYENDPKYRRIYTLGEWIVYCDEDMNFYFSNDGIYFVKVEFPPELFEYDNPSQPWLRRSYYGKHVYEYNNEIICDMHRTEKEAVYEKHSYLLPGDNSYFRFRIAKDEVYQKLNELKNATHVQLNDSYLAFNQPPVMEDDRTLVPMRFLFEQMGAEVDWNNDTQTATATVLADSAASTFGLENEKSVTFSIDNTTATVNGEAETMDVPARLINDQTFVPLRFLSENLGYNVEWDNDTRTAIITTGE